MNDISPKQKWRLIDVCLVMTQQKESAVLDYNKNFKEVDYQSNDW